MCCTRADILETQLTAAGNTGRRVPERPRDRLAPRDRGSRLGRPGPDGHPRPRLPPGRGAPRSPHLPYSAAEICAERLTAFSEAGVQRVFVLAALPTSSASSKLFRERADPLVRRNRRLSGREHEVARGPGDADLAHRGLDRPSPSRRRARARPSTVRTTRLPGLAGRRGRRRRSRSWPSSPRRRAPSPSCRRRGQLRPPASPGTAAPAPHPSPGCS